VRRPAELRAYELRVEFDTPGAVTSLTFIWYSWSSNFTDFHLNKSVFSQVRYFVFPLPQMVQLPHCCQMVQLPHCCQIIPTLLLVIPIYVDAQDNTELNAIDTTGINASTVCLHGSRHLQNAGAVPNIHSEPQLRLVANLHRKLSEHSLYYFRKVAATEQLPIPHTLVSAKLLQTAMHSALPAWMYPNVIPFTHNFVKNGYPLQKLQLGTHRQQTAGCAVGWKA